MKCTCLYSKSCHIDYNRDYSPTEFFFGYPNSKIWLIGVNPSGPVKQSENHYVGDKEEHFIYGFLPENDKNKYSQTDYFGRFQKVSMKLFNLFGKENGVAHTDLVKCFSLSWKSAPFKEVNNSISLNNLIRNCTNHLKSQLDSKDIEFPKIIICHGRPVVDAISNLITGPVLSDGSSTECTSYLGSYKKGEEIYNVIIINTGMIHRLDDYARSRLGKEIELYMDQIY
ncbi:uracil-DNA glycosylase family protein [Viridibacillus arvi]|uniref:uracil-DNA glycosylase family protein n=1 Tax=Viridibacillus arvi TaxID=263475 RepID=UPI003D01EBE9